MTRVLSLFILTLSFSLLAEASLISKCKNLLAPKTQEPMVSINELSLSKDRLEAIETIPALTHITTLSGLGGILRTGKISPYKELEKLGYQKAIGGASDSVYTGSYSGCCIRTGALTMQTPMILLSPDLLKREDFFFTESWNNYGSFDAFSSKTPEQLNGENARLTREIVFANEIDIKDYVLGIWIPKGLQQRLFQLISLDHLLFLKNRGIPIHYSDIHPTPREAQKLKEAHTGSNTIPISHLQPHPQVRRDVHYNLPDIEDKITYLENKDHPLRHSELTNNLIDFLLKSGWMNMTEHDLYQRIIKALEFNGVDMQKFTQSPEAS